MHLLKEKASKTKLYSQQWMLLAPSQLTAKGHLVHCPFTCVSPKAIQGTASSIESIELPSVAIVNR
jgi:hypothetical protein